MTIVQGQQSGFHFAAEIPQLGGERKKILLAVDFWFCADLIFVKPWPTPGPMVLKTDPAYSGSVASCCEELNVSLSMR